MSESGAQRSGQSRERTLEMRIAELEDKLAQMSISEEEMQTFQKVSGLMAARGGASAMAPNAALPIINRCIIHCIIQHCIIHCTIISDCACGPCIISPTAAGNMAGFGRLGM
jgi:hypothetical protein